MRQVITIIVDDADKLSDNDRFALAHAVEILTSRDPFTVYSAWSKDDESNACSNEEVDPLPD